jgi:hypothetical protein
LGFCCLWIPGSSVIAGPLYVALKGNPIGPLHWGPDQEDTFQKLKCHLSEAQALAFPDVTCPFHLYVHEKGGIELGILTQPLGLWNWPVAYLSKKLGPMASGWPPCLWALAVVVLLIQEADKLTLGQCIISRSPPSDFSAQRHCQSMDDQVVSGQISGFVGQEPLGAS